MIRSVFILAAALVAVSSVPASGQSLPVVVDATGDGERAWWSVEIPTPSGRFDEEVFARALEETTWLSPRDTVPEGAISSLFRRTDITRNNARALAELYGAETVVVGTLTTEEADTIGWLELERAAFVLQGALIDVRSGAVREELGLRAVAFGETQEEAEIAAASLLVDYAEDYMMGRGTDGGEFGIPSDEPVVVVASTDGALAYIDLRGALRDVHLGIIDVQETWAIEGRVALDLVLDEGVLFDDVVPSLQGMEGARFGEAQVDAVEVDSHGVFISVRHRPSEDG